MAYIKTDNDTKITHIAIVDVTLCGIASGWTRPNSVPVKEKYGITCEYCQDEIKEIKALKK